MQSFADNFKRKPAAVGWMLIGCLCCLTVSTHSVHALSTTIPTTTADLPNIKAAVLVPGFLTGAHEFRSLQASLTERGIPTHTVNMPNWHWLPCLGGRSMRPMLERLDHAVRHVASSSSVLVHGSDRNSNSSRAIVTVPPFDYTAMDLVQDFLDTPGGIMRVGGSDKVNDYPNVTPRGRFTPPTGPARGKIALIGHSAGGWISRIYLSERLYGGRAYRGSDLVHSLVTLGTPHASAPGPAFEGISWINEEPLDSGIRQLAVGGTGFKGGDWGALTQNSYSFCCANGSDVTQYDGDGVTPIHSALAWQGAEQLVVKGTTHFCWSDTFGSRFVAPELTADHKQGTPWYGSDEIMDQWVGWLDV